MTSQQHQLRWNESSHRGDSSFTSHGTDSLRPQSVHFYALVLGEGITYLLRKTYLLPLQAESASGRGRRLRMSLRMTCM
jgi:hypothetical protein